MLDLTESQIAWIAGILEGEGYFGIDNRGKKRYENSKTPPTPYIRLAMTDEDVVAKFSTLVDKPYFIPNRKTLKDKTVYILHIGEREKVLFLLEKILPHMGKRRSERIKESISYIKEWKEWVENGGRVENAKRANQISQLKRSKSQDMTVLMG